MNVSAWTAYRLHPVAILHWSGWNDEYVVFEEASGQTHQLDAVRAFVLHRLSDGSQTYSGIMRALAEVSVFSAESGGSEILHTVLNEFVALGLVEVIEQ
jgi:PqqD family protein of HPr-rel-A system